MSILQKRTFPDNRSYLPLLKRCSAGAATSTSQVHLVAVCLPGVKADRKGIANEQFWTKSERGAAKGVHVLGLRISPHGCHVPPAHLPPDLFFNARHRCDHEHFLITTPFPSPIGADEKILQYTSHQRCHHQNQQEEFRCAHRIASLSMNVCLYYPQGIWRNFIRRPFLREEDHDSRNCSALVSGQKPPGCSGRSADCH